MKKLFLLAALFISMGMQAQEFAPKLNGTIRARYEYQIVDNMSHFQVRNARVGLSGKVIDELDYKAEIDLSDCGEIKMLDAWMRLKVWESLKVKAGQMRVPFAIDPFRSPHLRYFANRSFLAKHAANVRDVGAQLAYTFDAGFPITVEAGLFAGSGIYNQKNYWTKGVNFAAKAQAQLPEGFNVALSTMKISPLGNTVMMYDIGAYYHANGWHIEAEYLYKDYGKADFYAAHAFNAFVNYDIKVDSKNTIVRYISPLARFDMLSDHADVNSEGTKLENTDYRRARVTAGVNFSLAAPFVADVRLNYEKFFYRNGAVIDPSEDDKIVVEFVTRF